MKRIILSIILYSIALSIHGSESFGTFTPSQLCKAGIATNNGHSPKGVKLVSNKSGLITVKYTRDDGKIFVYSCKIEGDQIRWRDKTITGWSKTIKLYYSLSNKGKQLDISSVVFGDPLNKSYALSDFK